MDGWMDGVSFPWTALVLAGRSAVAAVQGRYSNIGFPNIHFYIGTFSNWTNGRLRKIFLAKLVWNTLKYSQNHLFSWPLSVLGLVEFQLFSSIAGWVKTHKFAFTGKSNFMHTGTFILIWFVAYCCIMNQRVSGEANKQMCKILFTGGV